MKEKRNDMYLFCIGVLMLSIELYLVRIIQASEKVVGHFYEEIGYYFKEPIILIPMIATICVIGYSLYSLVRNCIKDSQE